MSDTHDFDLSTLNPFIVLTHTPETTQIAVHGVATTDAPTAIAAVSQELANNNQGDSIVIGALARADVDAMQVLLDQVEQKIHDAKQEAGQ